MQTSKFKTIVPAILAKDWNTCESEINLVKRYVDTIQIDVTDGLFVSSVSWPFMMPATEGQSPKYDKHFSSIINESSGLPGWQELNFEVDLMVSDVLTSVSDWAKAGASRVILHMRENNISQITEAIESAQAHGLDVGVSITPTQMSESLQEVIKSLIVEKKITTVQCMGILHEGFQHQSFDIRVFDQIKAVKQLIIDAQGIDENQDSTYPGVKISVDGGVSIDNAHELFECGADYLISGSGVFDAGDVIDAIENFAELSGELI